MKYDCGLASAGCKVIEWPELKPSYSIFAGESMVGSVTSEGTYLGPCSISSSNIPCRRKTRNIAYSALLRSLSLIQKKFIIVDFVEMQGLPD